MPSLGDMLRGVLSTPEPQGRLSTVAGMLRMPPAIQDPSVDPSWYRQSGQRKGSGFLGELLGKDGRTSTELSVGVDFGHGQMDIPSLVPGLSPQEIQHLLGGGDPTDAIMQKAVNHARMRMQQGLPVFKEY